MDALANPFEPTVLKAGGPSDFSDPNPVDAETVYLLMSKNFPPDAISWVKAKTTSWVGPVWVPWDRIDTDDKDKWAASHQPAKVKEFEEAIRAHAGHVAPSILVQEPKSNKAFIVDGHHRAVAHENLGQKVLAYLGNIDPKDRQAAEETHSKQIHSGADPRNKQDTAALLAKLEQFWYSMQIGHPGTRTEVFKVLAALRDAGRDEHLLQREAADFGWTLKQLDSPFLRSWLCEKSAQTPVVSTVHHPLGHEGLWHTPSKKVPEKQQLPAYIQNTARALMRDGMGEQEAIATAVNAVKAWAAGRAFGGKVKVTPEVQAAAQRAISEWEALRASHDG